LPWTQAIAACGSVFLRCPSPIKDLSRLKASSME
jgi:hypothetical protein